jgi:cytochrome c oxidase assembly protein Cox11
MKEKINSIATPAVGIYLCSLAISMIGLAYISVPLYQLFCQSFGGTGNPLFGLQTQKTSTLYDKTTSLNDSVDTEEETYKSDNAQRAKKPITICFNADTSENLP